ncbi:MAG: hypothetical protein K6G90_06905 [Clostridia bacterium]|nr:hypothetical protein [Clostridia bacterium]
MGIFSKKTYVCECCGKEFEARSLLGRTLCNECEERELAKYANISGYIEYSEKMKMPDYTEQQKEEIAEHRDAILEKYRLTQGISMSELRDARYNYSNLSDSEAADILMRSAKSAVSVTLGSGYTNDFFVPTKFSRTVIDTEDVFAVGLVSDYKSSVDGAEALMAVVFTNDPYIPAFPFYYLAKLGFFEVVRSKKGRAATSLFFESMCPNLTYPVMDLKKLKKQIKNEGAVRGNIAYDRMMDIIQDANVLSGIFNSSKNNSSIDIRTEKLLEEYGYIPEYEVMKNLELNERGFCGHFWRKQMKKLEKAKGL